MGTKLAILAALIGIVASSQVAFCGPKGKSKGKGNEVADAISTLSDLNSGKITTLPAVPPCVFRALSPPPPSPITGAQFQRFMADHRNFNEGDCYLLEVTTISPVTLVNVHIDVSLENGERSLNWLVPLDVALRWSSIGDIHESLALPIEWSNGKLRDTISFVQIPPGKKMDFMIGTASPQHENTTGTDRVGGGIQIRNQHLPQGSETFTGSLLQDENKRATAAVGISIARILKRQRFYREEMLKNKLTDDPTYLAPFLENNIYYELNKPKEPCNDQNN